jgi:hypothetical protein
MTANDTKQAGSSLDANQLGRECPFRRGLRHQSGRVRGTSLIGPAEVDCKGLDVKPLLADEKASLRLAQSRNALPLTD